MIYFYIIISIMWLWLAYRNMQHAKIYKSCLVIENHKDSATSNMIELYEFIETSIVKNKYSTRYIWFTRVFLPFLMLLEAPTQLWYSLIILLYYVSFEYVIFYEKQLIKLWNI